MAADMDLAEFLFKRVHQLGVRAIHGVPGDYNLTMLDYIAPAGLDWVSNCNELNGGYATDGYARIKGIGAMVTTSGVGELSAINAVAGAYAEMAPLVHIVGTPSTGVQNGDKVVHHTLGDGRYRIFAEMHAKITVAQANLIDPKTAPAAIDHALRECILQSRPVYIELPTDMVSAKVPASSLSHPIDLSIPPNDEGFEDAEVDLILEKIYAAKQPFIIVDGFTSRYGVSEEANELVRVTGFPTSTTPFGKGIINETLPNFHGVYAGIAGKQVYMPWAQSCDLVLRLGPLSSDVNTYGFTTIPDPDVTITFHRDSVEVGDAGGRSHYKNLHIKGLLRKILDRLDESQIPKMDPYPDLGWPSKDLQALAAPDPASIIDQATFYQRVSKYFRSGDIILTETGTPSLGGRDFVLPPDTHLINSSIWLSIGYMLGAAQGAALAHRELIAEGKMAKEGRTILFEGDGSLQMTAQELSTMIRNKLDITIFVLNNDGYTIERWIHGMDASFNDVARWRYLEAPSYFGASDESLSPAGDADGYRVETHRAENWGQLTKILESDRFQDGRGFKMVEVMMDREDAPESLKKLVLTVQKRNKGDSKEEEKEDEVQLKAASVQ